MARHAKLVKKMQQLVRDIKDRTRGKYDRMDLREEVMSDSPGVLVLMRGHQRRLDDDFQADTLAAEPLLAVDMLALNFDRFDFGVSDFGVRMVLATGLVDALGLQAGDRVMIMEGDYEGMTVEVTEVVDSETLRFEDDAGKSSETNISATARLSSAT